jgi:PKD repeat protein
MKRNLLILLWKRCGVLFLILLPFLGHAQLSGNYTINPTISASNTNYQNWASAVGDLISGSRSDGGNAQGSGVSGAVVFSVYDTVYNNVAVEITAITGASSTNSITFKSSRGDSSKCILKNASSSSSTNDFVLSLYGADYINFKQIGFERTGTQTYCTVVQIWNDADYNTFTRCYLRGRKMPSNSSLGFNYGIGSCFFISGNADYTQLLQNRMLYGYNGLYCATANTGFLIDKNIIDTSGSAGIYMTGQTTLRITNNQFRMGDFGPNQGHYTSYGMRIESSPSMVIAGNKVQMLTVNSQVCRAVILASTTSTASAPTLVYNNWILNSGGTGDCTGLAVYLCSYLNFYYNNVLINSSLSSGAAYYHYPQYSNSYIRLINNNLINKGAGYAINVPGTNTADFDSVDYNNLYSAGTNLGQWSATNYTSMSAWKSNTGKDANSMNLDPGYLSTSDLHISSIGLNGKALKLAWVKTDIDNEMRDTSVPDIGADEFFPVPRDIGITSLDSPVLFSAGTHNVKVRFQNYGSDTIKSTQIVWQVNSVAQTSYNWTGVLAPGATSAAIQIGTYSVSLNTPYTFKMWTRIPNSLSDGKPANDTLKVTRMAGLSGSYNLGDTAGSDFKSFNDAINSLSSRGISGPITFNVRPGVYNEQITFLQLPGMGANNPIVFQNRTKDSSNVIITLPSTTATGNNNATLQLRGADYVTFKGITFTRTGVNPYAYVIHILNGSNHNTFSHCQMVGVKSSSSTATAVNVWSDAGVDEYNVFSNNNIRLGTYNFLYTSGNNSAHEQGTVLDGNVFDSSYNQAVLINYNDGMVIKNNTFLNNSTALSGNSHIQLKRCDNLVRIENNRFTGTNAESAVLLSNCTSNSSTPSLVVNNVVTKGIGKGFSIDTAQNYTFGFNSMYFSTNANTNAGIYSMHNANNGLSFLNNNIYMAGGDAFNVIAPSSITTSNYNNLISKGTQFSYWGAATSDLASLRSVSGKEQNSLSVDPFFTSSLNLHIINPLMKNSGTPIAGVKLDFDGEKRDSLKPDIGADEFKLAANDAGVSDLYKPLAGSCAGLLPLEIVLNNYGGDTLKSVTIEWKAAGVPQTPYTWTGVLLSKQSDTFVLGNFNFAKTLNPKFIIWSSLPNGQTDAIKFNDTFTVNRSTRALPAADAGVDQTACAGVGVVLGPNAVTGNTYVWNDIDNQVQVGTASKISVTPPSKTSYELIVTNSAFGCSKRDTVVVSINASPIANAGVDKSVCFGSFVSIGTAAQSGFAYSWSSSPSGYSNSTANPSVLALQTSLYILQKTITSSSCSDLDTVLVTVNALPTPSISGTAAMCQGTQQIYSTKSNVGSTYKWSNVIGQFISGQNSNSTNIKWNSAGLDNINVVETNSKGCKDTVYYSIEVYTKPISKFTATDACVGAAVQFSDSSKGATSWSWNFADGNLSTQRNPSHTFNSAASYNVQQIVSSQYGCVDTSVTTTYVNPSPKAKFGMKKGQFLDFTFADSTLKNGGTIVSYSWYFGDGDSAVYSSQTNPQHTYKTEGNYTVRLCVKTNRDCESCTTMQVSAVGLNQLRISNLKIYPNPNAGVFELSADEVIEQIEVMNVAGQVVQKIDAGSKQMKIDIQAMTDGIYFIRVQIDGYSSVVKIIKQG